MKEAVIVTSTINASLDRSCRADHVTPEKKLRCHTVQRQPGGGGINVARVVHELGGAARPVWAGGGDTADRLAGLLEEAGLIHLRVDLQATTRENIHLLDESSGSQYRLVMPGADVSAEEAERMLEATVAQVDQSTHSGACCYVVASGSLPPGVEDDYYARLSRMLPEEARLVVDTKGEPLRQALGEGAYLIKPNLAELEALAGRELGDEEAIETAARELIGEARAVVVVVSLGRGGALLVTEDGAERMGAPAVRTQSKVGAGDSMVGGLVLALARGSDLSAAVRFGIAAGAAAVMTPGTELCRRPDVERIHAGMTPTADRSSTQQTVRPRGAPAPGR